MLLSVQCQLLSCCQQILVREATERASISEIGHEGEYAERGTQC